MRSEYSVTVFTRRLKVLALRSINAHKYSHGVVGVIAGSEKYPGAALLCVGGARRGGAGYINYLELESRPSKLLLATYPDVVHISNPSESKANAWVIGAGAPSLPKKFLLPSSKFLILDADALNLVDQSKAEFTVITPHEGEFAQMGYPISKPEQRISQALKAAKDLHVFVLLKGPSTVIASPDGACLVESSGGQELAVAGTGDVLAGFVASMLASWNPDNSKDVIQVLQKSVRAHSLAAKRSTRHRNPMTATDLLNELPLVIR